MNDFSFRACANERTAATRMNDFYMKNALCAKRCCVFEMFFNVTMRSRAHTFSQCVSLRQIVSDERVLYISARTSCTCSTEI